jgi:steroid 5-alpha reductase family enzyme
MLRKSKFASLSIVILVYLLAIYIGRLITYHFFFDFDVPIAILIGDIAATVVVFIASYIFKNSSIYDPYWSVIPIVIILELFIAYAAEAYFQLSPQLLVLIAVSLWGIRLTYNWAEGWKNLEHEDWRYIMLRKDNPKIATFLDFSGIHLFPTLIVFLTLLPAIYLFIGNDYTINWIHGVGVLVFLISIFFETVGDNQLRKFKIENKSSESILRTGLWKYTRHPNYFGETLFWWSIYLLSFHANSPTWLILGPISITGLFLFISIPMMDKHHKAKRPEYEDYIKKTSAFFPWKPKG